MMLYELVDVFNGLWSRGMIPTRIGINQAEGVSFYWERDGRMIRSLNWYNDGVGGPLDVRGELYGQTWTLRNSLDEELDRLKREIDRS